MAGIEFDRQAFVQAEQARRNSIMPILGLIAGALALSGVGYLGYKMISSDAPQSPAAVADTPELNQIQLRLAEIDQRVEDLEKRKSAGPAPAPEQPRIATAIPSSRPAYKIKGASPLGAQVHPVPDPSLATRASVEQTAAAAAADNAANREAWKATSDRLADVVGVVGSQQTEISQTREDVNGILSKTVRRAMPFELRRGAGPEPIGPVSLVLKNTNTKGQRYTVCIYVNEQCIELKNRSVNEIVGFVISRNSPPLDFVATKILRDQIVGYLEVPAAASR